MDCHESLRNSRNDESFVDCFGDKSPRNDKHNESCYNSRNNSIRFTPKFYFILGIIFNLSLLAFFKYTDFLLENFNAFSKLARLDFDIPLPHILLPLALSFVTFQQIAFLFDCYKRTKGELNENLYIDFVDYALFISFFPQLIAGPIVHHREMMPQFASLSNSSLTRHSRELEKSSIDRRLALSHSDFSAQPTNLTQDTRIANNSNSFASCNGIAKSNNPSLRGEAEAIQNNNVDCHDSTHCVESRNDEVKSTINYEFLAKGIFIFSIGLFKKVFIADSFAKWANAGFSVVESGGVLNIAESWATSLSYTFQLYFDFSGYCDMAMGLALMFGIVLPLNFDSPYKSLNIAEFWRRWHITLGRFLKECVYIPLGGNRVSKILNLRNLFIVAFLSGIWHGAGWGFVIWGILHGVAMVIHRIYSWWLDSIVNHNNSSLRGARSEASVAKQSINHANQHIDCHDFATQNLAMTEKGSCVESRNDDKVQLCESPRNDAKILRFTKIHNNGLFLCFTQTRLYKFLCWFMTFNFINLAWIFFRAENLNGAVNLIKGMFGVANVEIPHKWSKIFSTLQGGTNEILIWIVCAFIVCIALKNSLEMLKGFDKFIAIKSLFATILLIISLYTMCFANRQIEFLYFNF